MNDSKPRTIDDRLDSLTQSVKALVALHRKTERELRKLAILSRSIMFDHELRVRDLEGDDLEEEK